MEKEVDVDGDAMFAVALLCALAVVLRRALFSSKTEKVGGRLRMAPLSEGTLYKKKQIEDNNP